MITSILVSHPEVAGVVHSVEITPAGPNTQYALKISDISGRPLGTQTEMYCPTCDALIEMPAGSLATYLQQHLGDLGGEDTLVEITFRHKGPRPAIAPKRYKKVNPTTKKFV